MFNRPIVIGVRQTERLQADQSPTGAMERLGNNTGNMMFTESLVQVLEGATWGSFRLASVDLEGRDAIVLAAANWINSFEDFGWLADRLEKTKLPVFLVGVGAQSTLAMEIPEVQEGTRRLLGLVRDRSTTMAARGAFTSDVLAKLGFNVGEETGCPSLLIAGPEGPPVPTAPIAFSPYCLNATRHGDQMCDGFQAYLYQQALKSNADIVLQSEMADIRLLLSTESGGVPDKATSALTAAYGLSDVNAIRAYLTARAHVFFSYVDWIAFMRTTRFCTGTRIHGAVASLVAGTPATLICHDSRTLEMAKSMSIPMRLSTDIDTNKALPIADLFETATTDRSRSGYQEYYRRFQNYFAKNGLSVRRSAMLSGEVDACNQG